MQQTLSAHPTNHVRKEANNVFRKNYPYRTCSRELDCFICVTVVISKSRNRNLSTYAPRCPTLQSKWCHSKRSSDFATLLGTLHRLRLPETLSCQGGWVDLYERESDLFLPNLRCAARGGCCVCLHSTISRAATIDVRYAHKLKRHGDEGESASKSCCRWLCRHSIRCCVHAVNCLFYPNSICHRFV